MRIWIHRAFLVWAFVSMSWLVNSMRTRGVPEQTLRSSSTVRVADGSETLAFLPVAPSSKAGLVFVCGSGVAAHAYAPLLRPIAEAGHPVFIVKLPYRLAPLESHKEGAANRARAVVSSQRDVSRWVIAGHSLGAAIATRVVGTRPQVFSGMVLIGTTHPKERDLSSVALPVTKIYGSNDGVAPPGRMLSNRRLLPKATRWVEIKGGNHSQFDHYGHQLLDGRASVSRAQQQGVTRAVLMDMLSGF